MTTYNVTIRGVTPLLMHNFAGSQIEGKSKDRKAGAETPMDVATRHAYILDGKLYQPSTHIIGALVGAGKHKKVMGKGTSKATYSKIVGYSVEIEPFAIIHKTQKWKIFSIMAVNPSTHGKFLQHRPQLDDWELSFQCIFDETEIDQTTMKELFDIAGRIVGIGAWRPEKKGRFGKFQVTKWEKAK